MDQEAPSKIVSQQRFVSGLSDFPKEGLDTSVYQEGIAIDHRHDPRAITLLPRTIKESGSTVTDLPLWAATYPITLDTYIYGNTGNLYKRTTAPAYSLLSQIPNSHGNGLFYYPEDDYLYGTTDKSVWRYGPISLGNPQLTLDFLQAQGGVPTNTNSLLLASASSQYATAPDTISLSITGDLALGAYINPASLPTVGNSMSLIAKWDESATARSYKFGIGAISGYFGSGIDGPLTISGNTTDSPIDSSCSGTIGTQILTATNASFSSGQEVLIHQTQGTGAGKYQRNTIQSYTAGVMNLVTPLVTNFTVGAQVLVLKQYTNVTVNVGVIWTAKGWNGVTGGILAFLANGTVTDNGTISANSVGFRPGTGAANASAQQGEGTGGAAGTISIGSNGNGGGGGAGHTSFGGGGGGGGGNATTGANGATGGSSGVGGNGGDSIGTADLTTMVLGGGGGGGGSFNNNSVGGTGGFGGGILFLSGTTLTINGLLLANGSDGSTGDNAGDDGGGGGGAGGSILLKCQVATLGANLVNATGGNGGSGLNSGGTGGTGSSGRVALDYLTSFTGQSSPLANTNQDSGLVTTTTYQLQLAVSSTGANVETLTQNVNIQTSLWQQVSVSWSSSLALATFFLNGISQGTAQGTLTAIHDNASLLYIGADKGASVVQHFYDGILDDVMIFSSQETSVFWNTVLSSQISAATPQLQAYYTLNASPNDGTVNANNLTLVNVPVYSANVPYAGSTTRLDIDLTQVGTGNTYPVPTVIIEDANDEIAFTPLKDPQKSMSVGINTVGTGNWTLTVHDSANHLIASVTVPNNQLHTGAFEFVFATPWRTLTNFTNQYHVHFTSSVTDGKINVLTSGNLSTAGYTTYFSILVTDTQFHPVSQMLNQMVIGNERYVAVYNGLPASYNPNYLVLPAGYRVRCFALWNEYLAIGVMRGNAITDFDQGRIYFWDGSALTFNFFIDVPEGGVNALLSRGASLYAWCGYTGYLFQYQTGLEGDKIKRIPHILESDTCEIFPGAVTTWRTLIRFGVGGNVQSESINRGVYSWGSFLTMGFFQQLYRESLSFDYPISTGNYGSTVNIGMVSPVQNKLLIGWQDGIAFGVDNVSFANPPALTGSVSLLLSDDGEAYKQKAALTLVIQHLPLQAGESIQGRVATDRGDSIVSGFNGTIGSTKTSVVVPGELYNEYQVSADLAASGNTSPTITSIAFERDLNADAVKLQTM